MLRDSITTCLVTGLLAPLTWELAESWPQRASAILYIGGAWTLWTVWKICDLPVRQAGRRPNHESCRRNRA